MTAKRTLLLFRHAKSDWNTAGLDDHERPLNRRGTKAAPAMGRYMSKEDLKPGLILCSDSVRTRATLALILPEFGPPSPETVIDDGLYLASAETVLDTIRRNGGDHDSVMVIGHNPGLHALALTLVGDGPKKDLQQMAMKFPTGALAVISFDIDDWMDIAPTNGRLDRFVVPRDVT